MKGKIVVLNIVLPLLAGLVLYLVLSPDTYVAAMFYRVTKISPPHIELPYVLNVVIRGYLADACWAYALGAALYCFIGHRTLSIIIAIGFEIVMEVLQLTDLVSGTFDFCDIVVEIIFSIIAVLVVQHYINRREINEEN